LAVHVSGSCSWAVAGVVSELDGVSDTMITEEQRALLRQFFGAYFHQDWECDASDTKSVVSEYMKTATARENRLLAEAALQYSAEFNNDGDLEESLFTDLGCYYLPSGDGLSAKPWLQDVANQLLQGPGPYA